MVFSRFRISLLLLALLAPLAHGSAESESALNLGERFFRDSLYNLALEQYRKFLSAPHEVDEEPQAQFRIAQCYYHSGNMREAATGFDSYARTFSTHSEVMEGLFLAGASYASLGEYKEASERYYMVWRRFTGNARAKSALYEAAVCADKDRNVERAAELYETFWQRFGSDSRARDVSLALARIHMAARNYAAAEEAIEKGRKAWGNDKGYAAQLHYRKAQLSSLLGRGDEAAASYAAMLKAASAGTPGLEDALQEYIALLTTRSDYAASLPVFARLEQTVRGRGGSLSASVQFAWAENARFAKNYRAALKLYQDLVADQPDSIDVKRARYAAAECRVGANDFAGAIETLQDLALDDSGGEYGARAVLKIGDLYYARDLHVAAIAAYRRYLQMPAARSADAIVFRIATIYQDKFGQYGSAAREYEDLLNRFPSSGYAGRSLMKLAQCFEALGDFQGALRHYRYLVESEEQGEMGAKAAERVRYIEAYRLRDTEGAALGLARILERGDSLSAYERLSWLARMYERSLKDYERAVAMYEQVTRLDPPPPDSVLGSALFALAHCHERLSEKAKLEGNEKTAAYMQGRALELYAQVGERFGDSRWGDDAAFRVMMLGGPEVGEYEKFAAERPQSAHLPEVLYAIAQHYERAGRKGGEDDTRRALEAYASIVTRHAASDYVARAMLGVARGYLSLGRLDSTMAAVRTLEQVSGDERYKPEARYLKAVVLRRQGKTDTAIETFRDVLYQYPFSAFAGRARYELAEAQLSAGALFEALNNYRVYAQNHPEGGRAPEALLGMASCLARLGRAGEARDKLQEVLDGRPDDSVKVQAYTVLAQIAETEGDAYKALDYYRKVVAAARDDAAAGVFGQLGELYFENRMYEEASDAFKRAYERSAVRADSLRHLRDGISSLLMAGKGKVADKLIADFKERYGESSEDFAEIVFHEGLSLMQAKEYDKASNRFRYILSKFADSKRADDAAYQTALSYYYDDKKDRALELFTDFSSKYPRSELVPYARFKAAMVLHEREDYARAAEQFALVAVDTLADARTRLRSANNAALDYQRVSGWLDAARMYRLVLEGFPGEVPVSAAHLKIGFCLVQASRFEEAIKHFVQANVNPTPDEKPEVLYWLGYSYARTGEHEKAITELLKVPYLYSGAGKWGVTAEFEAARLYERRGEYERAKSLYAKIVRSDGETGQFGKAANERLRQLNNLVLESP